MVAFNTLLLATLASSIANANPLHAQAAPVPEADSAVLNSRASKPLDGLDLRVLPLGDSITAGFQSTDGTGYRGPLLAELSDANDAEFIGTEESGQMGDNNNAGFDGLEIGQIAAKAVASIEEHPNVVLLHAGTNDCRLDYDLGGAGGRLGDLLDSVLDANPDAAVLVARIIGSSNATLQSHIDEFNKQVPDVVKQRSDDGAHVLEVDMSHVLDPATDMFDQWHPNDKGYQLMADAWMDALETANANGWLDKNSGA